MGHSELLFYKFNLHAVLENQKTQLKKYVESFGTKEFENHSFDELADELAEKFSIFPPKLLKDEIEVSQREADVEVGGRYDAYSFHSERRYVKGTSVDVKIPFTGDGEMFRVKPSTFDMNPPRGDVSGNKLELTISGTDLTGEKIKLEIDGFVASVERYLKYQADSLGDFPNVIRAVAFEALNNRKEKLEKDSNLLSGLGYKISES